MIFTAGKEKGIMKEKERKAFYDDDSNWKPHLEDRDFRVLKLRYKRLTFYRT